MCFHSHPCLVSSLFLYICFFLESTGFFMYICVSRMNCHLTAGADTPIHAGLDIILCVIQLAHFSLPPSFLPLCSLSCCGCSEVSRDVCGIRPQHFHRLPERSLLLWVKQLFPSTDPWVQALPGSLGIVFEVRSGGSVQIIPQLILHGPFKYP